MRHLALAAVLLAAFLLRGVAGAVSLPVVEVDCGSAVHRCYQLDPAARRLVTTPESPHATWTIDPVSPSDPESWRLIGVDVGFAASASFYFVFAGTNGFGSATLRDARFVDSAGRVLLASAVNLDAHCFVPAIGPFTGSWTCSDGNSMSHYRGFGKAGRVPNDPVLPSFDGPITIDATWDVYLNDVPIGSALTINGIEFSYVYEHVSVPEPGTLGLVTVGLLGLAAAQRRRRRSRAGQSAAQRRTRHGAAHPTGARGSSVDGHAREMRGSARGGMSGGLVMRCLARRLALAVALATPVATASATPLTFDPGSCSTAFSRCEAGVHIGAFTDLSASFEGTFPTFTPAPSFGPLDQILVSVSFNGAIAIQPSPPPPSPKDSGGAAFTFRLTLLDGTSLLSGYRLLELVCRISPDGSEACSDSNSALSAVTLSGDEAATLLGQPFVLEFQWIQPTLESNRAFEIAPIRASGGVLFDARYATTPAAPEPAAAVLYAGGVVVFAMSRRRRNRRARVEQRREIERGRRGRRR